MLFFFSLIFKTRWTAGILIVCMEKKCLDISLEGPVKYTVYIEVTKK